MADQNEIVMYTSSYCAHSWAVERFMDDYEIPVRKINIDHDPAARAELVAMNHGYASVPTLLLPDGTRLVEPSFRQLRELLQVEHEGLFERVWGLFRREDD